MSSVRRDSVEVAIAPLRRVLRMLLRLLGLMRFRARIAATIFVHETRSVP